MGIAPAQTFALTQGIVCPSGELEYSSIRRSYHKPGESEPHIECVSPDGGHRDVFFPAVVTILGIAFLGVLIPVFVIGALVVGLLQRFLARGGAGNVGA